MWLCKLPDDTMIKSFICSLCVQRKHEHKLTEKRAHFSDKRKASLECSCPWNPRYYLKHRIKTTGLLGHVEPWLYMCDSVPLAKADARQCVSSSLLPQDRRDGSDFSIACVPHGITMARVTLFLSYQETTLQTEVWFRLHKSCLLFLSTSTPPLTSPPYLQEHDWTDMLG